MSDENVKIVRDSFVAFNRGDLDAFLGFWESDGDYYPVRGFPEARPCHGREEIADFRILRSLVQPLSDPDQPLGHVENFVRPYVS